MVASHSRRVPLAGWFIPPSFGTVLVLLVCFWAVFLLFAQVPLVRVLPGSILLFLVPGLLLLDLVGVQERRVGVVGILAIAASTTIVTVATLLGAWALSLVQPVDGLAPLSEAVALTGVVGLLLTGLAIRGRADPMLTVDLPTDARTYAVVLGLPVLGFLAAVGMRLFGTNVGSYLFIASICIVVLAVAWKRSRALYPVTVYGATLGLLLHRNVASPHVVGADIQRLFAVSHQLFASQTWSPGAVGSGGTIPGVTALPVAVSKLLGTPFAPTFTFTLVALFSLVPLGVYYLTEDLFDADAAFYSGLLFGFYHLSFGFTPGKQLVSELFVVVVLVSLGVGVLRRRRPVLLIAAAVGLILTHYGATYLFGLSLLVAAAASSLLERRLSAYTATVPVTFPLAFLGAATAWYAYTSPPLIARLAALPARLLRQGSVLLAGGTIEQSGASFATSGTTLLQTLPIVIYGLMAGLAGLGLLVVLYRRLVRGETDQRGDRLTFALVGVPLLAFMGLSYVFVVDLWADRVFQLVLVVLATAIPVGYRWLRDWSVRLGPDLVERPARIFLPCLVVALLLLSSGFAYAAAGQPETSTFDDGANDLSFDADDLAAVEWLHDNAGIAESRASFPPDDPLLTVDYPRRVQIYTDPTTYQLFRGTIHPDFYTSELVVLKNQWRPTVDPGRIETGYVVVRSNAIVQTPGRSSPPYPERLTADEVARLRALGPVVYERGGITIIRSTADDAPATSEPVPSESP